MGSGGRGSAHRPAQRGVVPDPVILELRFRPPDTDDDQALEDGGAGDVARADLARQLNASIYKAAQTSAGEEDEELEFTFFCACGCMAEVKRSLRDYVARGVIVPGHARPAGSAGHRPDE
jgi:hypothetical protein